MLQVCAQFTPFLFLNTSFIHRDLFGAAAKSLGKRKMREVATETAAADHRFSLHNHHLPSSSDGRRSRVQNILNNAAAAPVKPFSYMALLTADDDEDDNDEYYHPISNDIKNPSEQINQMIMYHVMIDQLLIIHSFFLFYFQMFKSWWSLVPAERESPAFGGKSAGEARAHLPPRSGGESDEEVERERHEAAGEGGAERGVGTAGGAVQGGGGAAAEQGEVLGADGDVAEWGPAVCRGGGGGSGVVVWGPRPGGAGEAGLQGVREAASDGDGVAVPARVRVQALRRYDQILPCLPFG